MKLSSIHHLNIKAQGTAINMLTYDCLFKLTSQERGSIKEAAKMSIVTLEEGMQRSITLAGESRTTAFSLTYWKSDLNERPARELP